MVTDEMLSDIKSDEALNFEDTIGLPCLECGKILRFSIYSYEATGVFNVFCKDSDCEDKFAARL